MVPPPCSWLSPQPRQVRVRCQQPPHKDGRPGVASSTKVNYPDGDSGPWVECEPLWEFLFLQMQNLLKIYLFPLLYKLPSPGPCRGESKPPGTG